MNLNGRASWLTAGLYALVTVGPAIPSAGAQISVQFGRGEKRLEGPRWRTMRELAHRLDEAAEQAARVAGDTAQERNGRMRQRFLWAINDFARQTRSFHERMDQYGTSPWDVADEVAALNQRARQVSSQIRGANAFPETYDDWAEAVSALNLMTRSLGGQDVAVPSGDRRPYPPFDERSRYRDGRHLDDSRDPGDPGDRNGYVTGAPLREFRRLAGNLSVETERAVAAAERNSDPSDRGDRRLSDLRQFAQRASDLQRSSGADALDPREIGPVIGRLMDDARRSDRGPRDNGGANPRDEWGASIRLLEQMAAIVPSP
jgi:hypothetical protein